jgi:hemerythrin superfamily protein
MDAIELLVSDHHEVDGLFTEFEGLTDGMKKATLAWNICKELTVHVTIEEELFYPKARECLKGSDEGMVDDAIHEHTEAKDLIAKIKTLSTGSELDSEMKKLKAVIKDHVKDEEEDMFPKLKELGMETTQLGSEMSQRKTQLIATL